MAVYMIAQVKVTDDAWLPEYAAQVHNIVHRHGGEYLARSANIVTLEGDAPDATVIGILKFPTLAAAESFVGRSRLRAVRQSQAVRECQSVLRHRRH